MPLNGFQREVMAIISCNQSPESHFSGSLVLHAIEGSVRYSNDFDVFHESSAAVNEASLNDCASLESAGYEIERQKGWDAVGTFRDAKVRRGDQSVEIDRAADSAFRFFPIEQDPVLGWRLHLFDMATNKALALSARTETRDYVDILELADRFSLEAIC